MEKFLEEFVSSLDRLYYTYENYIWKNDDSKLDVLIQDNTISFYLYKNNDVIDEIIFSFDEKEKSIYNYLCVRLLVILLGNVYIYNKDNVFYNDTHKTYLKLIVNDDNVLDIFKNIVSNQEDKVIGNNMDLVLRMRERLTRKRYYDQFIYQVNDRIELSKKLLRRV